MIADGKRANSRAAGVTIPMCETYPSLKLSCPKSAEFRTISPSWKESSLGRSIIRMKCRSLCAFSWAIHEASKSGYSVTAKARSNGTAGRRTKLRSRPMMLGGYRYMVRGGGLEPPRCYPLAPQANHRTRCHTIVSIYERVRGVIERDWGRQLAQKRHNLPSPQNGPSGPWVEPYLPKFWNHFRKGTKRRASRASAPLRSTGLGLPSQDRSLLLRLSPTRCAARFMPLLLPTRTCRFGPVFTRATPPGFGSTARRSPKKVAARLRNPGEPRTLRPSLCLGR